MKSLEATQALAAGVADLLSSGDVVALHGDLGAGKTTFVRAVAQRLGADAQLVASPTFVFVNQYPFAWHPQAGQPSTDDRGQIIHVDAYRLTSSEDLDTLGWDVLFDPVTRQARPGAVAFIEWPERIAEALSPRGPADRTVHITLEHDPEISVGASSSRIVRFEFPEDWRSRRHFEHFAQRVPIRCATTQRWVSPTSPSYPFIDERARLADLNRWFTGSHSISSPLVISEDDDSDPGDDPVDPPFSGAGSRPGGR